MLGLEGVRRCTLALRDWPGPLNEAAAAELEHNSYDCVLVDLDMPGLNGIELIERAKPFL